jgi:aspartyl-tRNA(Asn)/glutamyl-tRNA(Gln) amidotransferase subunit C
MDVDKQTVQQIARLARIRVSDDEASELQGELSSILAWVEQLEKVDTGEVAPMTRVVPIALRQRDDEVTDGDKAEDVIANAPISDKNFFVVPKVVE